MKKLYIFLLCTLIFSTAQAQTRCASTVSVSGITYDVVQVGSQCWIATNLRHTNYSDGTPITPAPISYSAEQFPNMDMNKYGLLYTMAAATRNGAEDEGYVQGICPMGWHIPTPADIEVLMQTATPEQLMATEDWIPSVGTNTFGFGLYPSGNYNSSIDRIESFGVRGYFLSYDKGTMVYHPCEYGAACGSWEYIPGNSADGYSVRCVLDEEFVCGTSKVRDVEGNEYNTVKIGTQCWTKENLRTRNVNGVGNVYDPSTSGETGYENYDVATYGLLYDCYATVQSNTQLTSDVNVQGICPTGWHVPSEAEWKQLTSYVKSQPAYVCAGCSGTDDVIYTSCIAKALSSATGWESNSAEGCNAGNSGTGSNATGFSALPAGKYDNAGTYERFGNFSTFWSATLSIGLTNEDAVNYSMDDASDRVYRSSWSMTDGRSVRCVRNEGFECGTSKVRDVEGNKYNTVKIGTQCWMKENLRTRDVNGIGNVYDPSTSGQYGYENYDVATYGLMYDYYATIQSNTLLTSDVNVRGICPTGWHVPSDAEWKQLISYVKSQSAYVCAGCSGIDEGDYTHCIAKALSTTTGWRGNSAEGCSVGNSGTGSNATGFTALPAGFYNLLYIGYGGGANFWSATGYGSTYAYGSTLFEYEDYVLHDYYNRDGGFSVRCVRN